MELHPTAAVSGMGWDWPDVSGPSVFREETVREKIVTSSWGLVCTSRSHSLSAGQDEWVGNSFSNLWAPTADVTLRLSH